MRSIAGVFSVPRPAHHPPGAAREILALLVELCEGRVDAFLINEIRVLLVYADDAEVSLDDIAALLMELRRVTEEERRNAYRNLRWALAGQAQAEAGDLERARWAFQIAAAHCAVSQDAKHRKIGQVWQGELRLLPEEA